MVNSKFESFDEGDYPSLDIARRTAIKTATTIAAESVSDSHPTAAVEIEIQELGVLRARHVVTLSIADLSGGE